MGDLERAIALAAEAHSYQTDKGGQPYILHPLRVMAAMKTNDERIVAVLHDVAEDCPQWSVDKLADEFGATIGRAIDAITKRKAEDYGAYLSRVAVNRLALAVKFADLSDNMDLTRLTAPITDADRKRIDKYALAMTRLRILAPVVDPHGTGV